MRRRMSSLLVTCTLVVLSTLAGCDSETSTSKQPPVPAKGLTSSATGSKGPSTPPLARLEHQGNRCEVTYGPETPAMVQKEARCPREIREGEQLERTGATCFRQSKDPLRRGPTRCPSSLIELPSRDSESVSER